MANKRKGQGLVEFALILPVILILFCLIIESGRLFHAYTTVQHAAREGARYAVTGRDMMDDAPNLNRLDSIKYVTRLATGSLMVDSDKYWNQGADPGPEYYTAPGSLIIRVWGPEGEDDPGGPGERVRVHVVHNMPVITPLLMPIAKYVRVTGEVEMINEGFGSGVAGGSHQGVMPPPLDPLPTVGPSPIPPGIILLTVKADKTRIHSGDVVKFTYSVFNNLEIDLTGVEIADYWDNPVPGCTMDIPTKGTGSCTTNQTIDATMTNNVTASGGGKTSSDSVTITVINPELILTAGSYGTTVFRGDVLTFTYAVENTGDCPLTKVHVVDSLGGDTSGSAQNLIANGDTAIWGVAHVMDTPGTIVVNATAIGTDELGALVTDDDSITIEVLDLDPIRIFKPLVAGQTVVTGTAHPGRTVFIYDPQDPRVSGSALVNGAGEFSFAGLPPLIAGHTIVVSGYGSYDSALVEGTLAPIVITTDPLCHGTATIAGTAQPGETVYLSIPDIGYSDNVKTNVDTGAFQFTLYGGLTFQVDQVVTVSGYDAIPVQKTVGWCGGATDAFITINPQCGPTGNTTINVHGENFEPGNQRTIRICWDALPVTPGAGGVVCTEQAAQFGWTWGPSTFDQPITVDVTEGTHTIRAELWRRINQGNRDLRAWAETTYVSPCPAPNLIVTNVELQTTLPISTYMPVEFRVTVANTGTMPVNSLFWVDLYEPTLPPVGIPQAGLAWGAVSNLAPGDSVDVTVTYVGGFETTGDHILHARADSMVTVEETNEDDNDFTDFVVPVTLSGTSPGPTPGNGEINGYVLNAASGAGADRARVWAIDQTTGVLVKEDYADSEGYFVLADLPPGTYLLYAEMWIGGDYYFGALPTPVTIVGDDVVGPVIFFIRRQ